ncbi:MAG: GreA/GreB family elongation factor [Chlamydiales bacterium]
MKMSYLEDFNLLIENDELANFLRLWEEYCMAHEVDIEELNKILRLIKHSSFSKTFGQLAETILPLWKKVHSSDHAYETLRLMIDLQTTHSPLLADLATDFLKYHYGKDKDFNSKLRIVGLLTRDAFQGAISNYELLTHMKKGNFVFHTGGWGVGEVMEISFLREHVILEFEGIRALKDLSFENAFKHLIPLEADHFLCRRFSNPDGLEKEGKKDPISLIKLLLRDLGPKTAQEIKEELCELVILEKDWQKWWNYARGKVKKDTEIEFPKSTKAPFVLRSKAMPHEVHFKESLQKTSDIDHLILIIYNLTRDFSEILKNLDLKQQVKTILLKALEDDSNFPERTMIRKIQTTYLLEDIFPDEFSGQSAKLMEEMENIVSILPLIEINAFKKRTLTIIRTHRQDWNCIFFDLFFVALPAPIRDYIFKELYASPETKELLKEKIYQLLHKMTLYPEPFFWYFQKIASGDNVLDDQQESQFQFLEAFLILLHFIEDQPNYKDLAKKMYQTIVKKRYALIRKMLVGASLEYLREFLLLASKCHSFTKHDLRILQNLAEVVHPELAKEKKTQEKDLDVIWTTQEGYQKTQQRIREIGVETIDNAREIEAARALGDLRENSEYKFALERRSRLQAELKKLSQQVNKARLLTKEDITHDVVNVGAVVSLIDAQGKKIIYTLLGPWEANVEENILSFQSKFAQTMMGHKKGEVFAFQGKKYTIKDIKSYLG